MEVVCRPGGDRVRQVNGLIRNELDLAAGRAVSASRPGMSAISDSPADQENDCQRCVLVVGPERNGFCEAICGVAAYM
jgi:hypothetical protein